jgi:aspartyl-tRNA(Asn)/glutamyl-tRNA(Gln) amidotransferase subunit B
MFEVPLEDGTLFPHSHHSRSSRGGCGENRSTDVFQQETGIDLNRAGTPLLEIVTEPDFRSAEQAGRLSKSPALSGDLIWGSPMATCQEGSMRLRYQCFPAGKRLTSLWAPALRIKNVNSFRFVAASDSQRV